MIPYLCRNLYRASSFLVPSSCTSGETVPSNQRRNATFISPVHRLVVQVLHMSTFFLNMGLQWWRFKKKLYQPKKS